MTEVKEDGEKLFSGTNDADPKSPETAKFIPENDGKNGISPISVESVKTTFTGLTKEELMKYANDPFWVKTRWVLFILFWIIWFLMLFGAIYIIITTPKCEEEIPPTWWQRSPLYIIDVAKLSESNPGSNDNNSVVGILKNRIDYLKDLGVESLLLKNVLQTNTGAYEEVTNFTNINYYLESIDKFRTEIIEYAKSHGINIILGFIPNHSGKSEQFIRSAKQDEFKDFYIWYPANYTKKPEEPPNNWLSIYNGTAWEWHDGRKQFYLHQFHKEQPDFNFWNPAVREYFENIFKFWFDLGVINFHVDRAEYLFEDKNFSNETKVTSPGYNMYDYGFYSHHRTCDLPETKDILNKWSQLIRNHSGFFGVSGGVQSEFSIADIITKPIELPGNFDATVLNNTIATRMSTIRKNRVWQWKCPAGIDTNCFSSKITDGLMIISFLLPGTPILSYGQELNASASNVYDAKIFEKSKLAEESKVAKEKTADSRLNIVKELVKFRSLPAFVYGVYNSTVLNTTVFAFTRIKSGTPGHLVAWNLGKNETVVNFQVFSVIPEELVVELRSGFANDTYLPKSRVSGSSISMPPMAVIVFIFVPKQ